MSSVSPQKAERPLVLAIDLGTSSARAVIYDSVGRLLNGIEARIEYRMNVTPDGGVEIDADELIEMLCRVVDDIVAKASGTLSELGTAFCGVACCTFWHSLIGVGANGHAVTPLYNWSDTRSASDAATLAKRLGSEWLHARTGAVSHASYYPAKIQWLRRTRPHLIVRIARWASIGEYFYERLFGRALSSVSMASGTGLFNPNSRDWDEEVLTRLEVGRERLSPLATDTESLSGLRPEFASRWPELKVIPWIPPIGDGAASNVGSGCVNRERVAINVGTSGAMRVCWPAPSVVIPKGLWCYLADREHYVMGGALSNGGDVFAWCRQTLQLDQDELEQELSRQLPDAHGLTMLPFFSGERSTGWADFARATIVGINLSTRPIDIVRASLEAVACRFAAIYELLREQLSSSTRLIASGGGILGSRVWPQIMADVIGVPVVASTAPEASSRGSALLALKDLGRIKGLDEVPVPLGTTYEPQLEHHEVYKRALARQERLYDVLIKPGPGVLRV